VPADVALEILKKCSITFVADDVKLKLTAQSPKATTCKTNKM